MRGRGAIRRARRGLGALGLLLLAAAVGTLAGSRAAARQGEPAVDVAALVDDARADLDQYWKRRVGWTYASPADVVRIHVPADTPCGHAEEETAFYCRGTRAIYWDDSFFARHARIGDFAAVFILAHEWAHHGQNLLGFFDGSRGLLNVQLELQADCMAGQYASDALRRGLLDDGDDDEAVLALRRAGDQMDSPWYDADAHGSSGQRIDSFEYGLAGRDCEGQPFWDFLKVRGVDPSRAPQRPTPQQGSLADVVPKQAGRFTLAKAERMTIAGATDAVEATYQAADGTKVLHTLAGFADAATAGTVFTRLVANLTNQGLAETKRADVTDAGGKRLGTLVVLHGDHEVVVWTNGALLGSSEGPTDVAWELFSALPY